MDAPIPPGVTAPRPLGAGSTFVVVAGRREGRAVVVRRPRGEGPEVHDAWRRHRAVLAAVGDRAIPPRLAEGRDAHGPWLVEARAPGVPLSTLIDAKGALPPPMVARLAEALLSTLARLHRLADAEGPLGFVHGDLGPDHVFLGPSRGGPGALTLVDFGLAGLRGLPPLPRGAHGTLPYASPERARGEAPSSTASDLYAAAATLAHAALGRPPASARGPALLVEIADRGLALDGLEEALASQAHLAAVLRALLAAKAADRPGIDEVLALLRR